LMTNLWMLKLFRKLLNSNIIIVWNSFIETIHHFFEMFLDFANWLSSPFLQQRGQCTTQRLWFRMDRRRNCKSNALMQSPSPFSSWLWFLFVVVCVCVCVCVMTLFDFVCRFVFEQVTYIVSVNTFEEVPNDLYLSLCEHRSECLVKIEKFLSAMHQKSNTL
jgi:H+/Cl- antiporter ClcA